MSDGESIFGVDTARYQPFGTYDPGAFSIVNFEDPQLEVKVRARAGARIAWGVYLWVYGGHDLNVDAQHMVDVVRGLGLGDPPAGYWADYEDAGINEAQLDAYFAGCDAKRAPSGYYSSPHAIDHARFLDRPWWNAAYPTGDVAFPGYGALWASSRPRPMHLWQYTSAGGLDRDVVVDEAWWAQLTGGAPAPDPIPIDEEDEDMKVRLMKVDDPSKPDVFQVFGNTKSKLEHADSIGRLKYQGLVQAPGPGIKVDANGVELVVASLLDEFVTIP